MEPPAKKRRQDRSSLDLADGDNDDELFESTELRARRDPEYRLYIEHAYSENSFQATMAHIFEKYGRDFEGIGDEIDIVTGEIVVDNGHLQNMRDEGDVGLTDVLGGGYREDKGFWLQDFTDDERDLFPSAGGHRSEGQSPDDEQDEEDRIMCGRTTEDQSKAFIMSRSRKSEMNSRPPDLQTGLLDRHHMPFRAPLMFGASLLDFGASPFAIEPWALPMMSEGPYCGPYMDRRLTGLPSYRYDFPVQNGSSSIWASNYRFTNNEPDRPVAPTPFVKALSRQRIRTKPMKRILASENRASVDDEDIDEDVILTGRSYSQDQEPQNLEKGISKSNIAEAEHTIFQRHESNFRVSRAAATSAKKGKHKRTRYAPCEASTEQGPACKHEGAGEDLLTPPETEEHSGEVRRRYRKQARRTRMVSRRGSEKQTGMARQRIVIELPQLAPSNRHDYLTLHDATHEQGKDNTTDIPPPPAAGAELGSEEEPGLVERGVTPAPSPTLRNRGIRTLDYGPSSALSLSDDEMPLMFRWTGTPGEAATRTPAASPAAADSPTLAAEVSPALHDSSPGDSQTAASAVDEAQTNALRRSSRAAATMATRHESSGLARRAAQVSATPDQAPGVGVGVAAENGPVELLTRELRWLRRQNGPVCRQSKRLRPAPGRYALRGEKPSRHSRLGDHPPYCALASSSDVARSAAPFSRPPASLPFLPPTPPPVPRPSPGLVPAPSPPPVSSRRRRSRPSPSPSHRPLKPTSSSSLAPPPPLLLPAMPKLQTPQHAFVPAKLPSSRCSILSLLSSGHVAPDDDSMDELVRTLADAGASALTLPSSGVIRKTWKSSPRTTEIYHTPVKRRPTDLVSPGSVIKTPGGTIHICGLDGYRCGRDFCFTCL